MVETTQPLKQIWIARGTDPTAFTAPVEVTWRRKKLAEIRPALPNLLPRHAAALEKLLNRKCRRMGNVWLAKEHILKTFATATGEKDAEKLFSWALETKTAAKRYVETPEMKAFLDELYLTGTMCQTRDELAIQWRIISKFIVHWLINRELPVDFVWFKLHQTLYRANWQQRLGTLLYGLNATWPRYFSRHTVPQLIRMIYRKKKKSRFMQGSLLMLDETHMICLRRLEVEHEKDWWKMVRHVETVRKSKIHADAYAAYLKDSILENYPQLIKLLKDYADSIETSFPTFAYRGRNRRRALVPTRVAYLCDRRRRLSDNNDIKAPVAAPSLAGKDGVVPEMSTVQPAAQDVRNGGGDS